MGGKNLAQTLALCHCLTHEGFGLDAPAVIGKGDDIGSHFVQLCKALTLLIHGDGTVGVYPNQPILGDGLQLGGEMGGTVGHGDQIGHGTDIAVSAVGCGQCTRCDGLFIQKTRLTKMYMNIDETGQKETMLQGTLQSSWSGNIKRSIARNKTTISVNMSVIQVHQHRFVLLSIFIFGIITRKRQNVNSLRLKFGGYLPGADRRMPGAAILPHPAKGFIPNRPVRRDRDRPPYPQRRWRLR